MCFIYLVVNYLYNTSILNPRDITQQLKHTFTDISDSYICICICVLVTILVCFKCLRFCYLTFSNRESVMGWVRVMCTSSFKGVISLLPQENVEKYTQKESISCNFRHICLYFQFPCYCIVVNDLLCFQMMVIDLPYVVKFA